MLIQAKSANLRRTLEILKSPDFSMIHPVQARSSVLCIVGQLSGLTLDTALVVPC